MKINNNQDGGHDSNLKKLTETIEQLKRAGLIDEIIRGIALDLVRKWGLSVTEELVDSIINAYRDAAPQDARVIVDNSKDSGSVFDDDDLPFPIESKSNPIASDSQSILAAIESNFDKRTRIAAEICLSSIASTRLKVGQTPVWIILAGPPSVGKTTVLSFFQPKKSGDGSILDKLVYRSDKFTPKSFVSHSANANSDKLKEIDLLPKIQHKILITPDLTTILGQEFDTVRETMSTLTTLADGKGLRIDSGTHGGRGYDGDYGFGWLGATTRVTSTSWKAMISVGPRLLFFKMDAFEKSEPSISELAEAVTGDSDYSEQVENIRGLVEAFLKRFTNKHPIFKGTKWNKSKDRKLSEQIAVMAKLTAKCRSRFEDVEGDISLTSEEDPKRLMSQLYGLACGHAALEERSSLEFSDLHVVYRVAISSMPDDIHKVILTLVDSPEEELTEGRIAEATGLSNYKVEQIISKLSLVRVINKTDSKISLSDPFKRLRGQNFTKLDDEGDPSAVVAA